MKRLAMIAVLSALTFAGCNRAAPRVAEAKLVAVKAGEIGSQLPDFDVKGLQGRPISSAELRGKVVLIDFWATWCEPCKKEMPGYEKLRELYGPQGFSVIGFKFDMMADTEDPIRFAKRIGVRYPLAIASDEVKSKFGGIEGLPTTMIYDRAGILRQKVIGFEYTKVIEADVKALL